MQIMKKHGLDINDLVSDANSEVTWPPSTSHACLLAVCRFLSRLYITLDCPVRRRVGALVPRYQGRFFPLRPKSSAGMRAEIIRQLMTTKRTRMRARLVRA